MNEITIDAATDDDIDRIAGLFFADMVDLGVAPSQEAMRATVASIIEDTSDDRTMFVARDEGLVVGVVFANAFVSVKFAGRSIWIEELYVAPAARKRGIGRDLVTHMMQWAAERGFVGVNLEAYRMNTAASILYRSLGFRRLARERYEIALEDFLADREEA